MAGGLGPIEDAGHEVRNLGVDLCSPCVLPDPLERGVPDAQGGGGIFEVVFLRVFSPAAGSESR